MGKKLFGTDGVRGRVNTYPMTADLVLRLGLAAGAFFRKKTSIRTESSLERTPGFPGIFLKRR